jgi:hypothetical protein
MLRPGRMLASFPWRVRVRVHPTALLGFEPFAGLFPPMGGTSSRLGSGDSAWAVRFRLAHFCASGPACRFPRFNPRVVFTRGLRRPANELSIRGGPWLRDNFHKGRHNHVNRVRLPGFAPICDPRQPMTLPRRRPTDPALGFASFRILDARAWANRRSGKPRCRRAVDADCVWQALSVRGFDPASLGRASNAAQG